MNDEQLKHLAKVLNFLSLAALAPVLGDVTGVKEIETLNGTDILIFCAFAFILEILAFISLGAVKND